MSRRMLITQALPYACFPGKPPPIPRRMLIPRALPYANGRLHLGHLVESVQTDVFVRAMKAMGRECVFICADDTHGTPIEISARKAGVPPEDWIARIHAEHSLDYQAFEI